MADWWLGEWPVVDPDIPEADRRRMVGNPRLIGRARGVPGNRRTAGYAVAWCLACGVYFGYLRVQELGEGIVLGYLAVLGVALAVIVPFGLRYWWRRSPRRLMRRYRGRYVTRAELDTEARATLARAERAIRAVYDSRVHRLAWLDQIANDVVLPRQLWEIARLSRSHTGLRAEQRQAAQGVVTPELRAVLDPQRAALARSVTAVERRVAMLEAYARRVQEADAALRAQDLLGSNDKYRELLARTDDTEGLRELKIRADAVEGVLARSVQDAVAAGHTLATLPEGRRD
ncbi:hypothetical protein Sru01_07310 [Sphaerisporangium rufum]|uniref:Uncharacterized protein n=1 Tax=Sphaerisporangium rufum TaxID=1381558 RepID=A0A919UXE2_9ACTN|nr:hypothetical protein [Sphaerisporangium rufum]GII75749.1 hypothetical protein Sru01_07310 [Sphaerisporangium rufum]